MLDAEKRLYRFFLLVLSAFMLAGLASDGPWKALSGFLLLQETPGRLISDFTVIAGTGAALLNSAAVGSVALGLVYQVRVRLAGPTVAAIFTMMGFSLFGTTPFNALPIILGVFLASRIARTSFSHYILIALMGTAIGPLLDFLFLEAGLPPLVALLSGMLAGLLAGILLPALAMTMLRLHQGFNLYNIGFTSGFIGLFASSILIAADQDLALSLLWNETPDPVLYLLIPVLSLALIAFGLMLEGRRVFSSFRTLLKLSGRLPSDFMELASMGATFLNMGILGLCGSAYVFVVGGEFNGPTLGGLLTLLGFSAFGKHPRNCAPVAAGVLAATIIFGQDPASPGALLAILFGTTLAPLAGEFGPIVGFAAGFIHLTIVSRSATWHGGLNLYNNGFAGGLTATMLVAVLEWYRSNHLEKKPSDGGADKKRG